MKGGVFFFLHSRAYKKHEFPIPILKPYWPCLYSWVGGWKWNKKKKEGPFSFSFSLELKNKVKKKKMKAESQSLNPNAWKKKI